MLNTNALEHQRDHQNMFLPIRLYPPHLLLRLTCSPSPILPLIPSLRSPAPPPHPLKIDLPLGYVSVLLNISEFKASVARFPPHSRSKFPSVKNSRLYTKGSPNPRACEILEVSAVWDQRLCLFVVLEGLFPGAPHQTLV